jgi:hypothetical protein
MSIWNKILIGLIITASLVFFYMSSRMLKTQKYWSDLAEKYSKRIDELQKNDKLCEEGGTVDGQFKPGIEQVRAELNLLNIDRQRVWYNCDPKVDINRQTGVVTVKVAVDQPSPIGIANRSIVYVFEEAPAAQKGQFLGEFKVTAVADKQVTLEPAFKITKADVDKLAQAKRPWDLYDSLPHDNHEILSQLSEQDKKAMLPADSAAEYIGDGQAAPQNAPPQQVADGKYVRPLRNYDYLFDMYRSKLTELVDKEEANKRDTEMVENTLADAKIQVQFYRDQVQVVKIVLAKIERQRDAVKAHLDKLKEKIAEAKADVMDMIKNNKAMAGQIAKIQLDATRRIDERTRAMAQSANGDK